jgi:hypothetical protein
MCATLITFALAGAAGALEAGALEAGALEAGALEAGALEAGALEAGADEVLHPANSSISAREKAMRRDSFFILISLLLSFLIFSLVRYWHSNISV